MEVFYGDWLLQVTKKNADFSQRFRITGSNSSDGIYYGITGTVVQVSGEKWGVVMEWNDGASSGWQSSAMKQMVTFTVADGLVKVLGADDNILSARDNDFDDLIITCKSLDPSLNPLLPVGIPFEFTYPENWLSWDNDKCSDENKKKSV